MNGSLTSNFSKVEFVDIPEAYGIAEPVTFRYMIASNLVPSSSDWIGLYRVGWKSTKDYVTYEWTILPDNYTPGTQVECGCTFKDNLPKNDEDFFQFCYINSQGKVCGASSPFQFLEDYDIVVISETESMVIVQTKPSLAKQPTITTDEQQRQPHTDELLVRQEEMERLTAELMEAKKHLMEKDSQLKDLGSEVNRLQSKLGQSEEMSSQLAGDVDRLKSELSNEKEKGISVENSFRENEKHLQKASSEFSERELAYQEKEMQLNVTVQDLQKQLCQKAQELELLKLEHSSKLSVLDVKQLTVEELKKRCGRMSAEISQLKKVCENFSELEMIWKAKEAGYQEQINHLQTASYEKRINQMVLEKQIEFHRNTENDVTVTDGVENLTGATAEFKKFQKESTADKVEIYSRSADQYGGKSGIPSKTCRVCLLTFPSGTSRQVISDHLWSHQKVCPVCNEHLELDCTQELFELHVSEHLADTIRYTDGQRICPMCQEQFPPAYAQDQFEIHVNSHFENTFRPN